MFAQLVEEVRCAVAEAKVTRSFRWQGTTYAMRQARKHKKRYQGLGMPEKEAYHQGRSAASSTGSRTGEKVRKLRQKRREAASAPRKGPMPIPGPKPGGR